MKKLLFFLFLVGFFSSYGQQYDVYVEYEYVGHESPYNGTGSVNINNTLAFNNFFKNPDNSLSEVFEQGVLHRTTNKTNLTWNARLNFGSFSGSDSGTVSLGYNNRSYFLIDGNGAEWIATIYLLERIEVSTNTNPKCYEETIELLATAGHLRDSYNWQYRGVNQKTGILDGWKSLPFSFQKRSKIDISLRDIYGENYEEYIGGRIDFKVINSYGSYESNIENYTWLDCSIELRENNPIQISNAPCHGKAGGAVTLNFKNDVEPGYEMRYFVFQGEPSEFSGDLTSENKPAQAFDEVRFSPPGPNNPNGLGALIDNGDGTYRGRYSMLEGSNSNPNAPPGEENQQNYYIIYQEVDYSKNPVEVKSGEILNRSFTIRQSSEIEVSGSITQAECNGTSAYIDFSAVGGNNLYTSGQFSYQYRLDGGLWTDPSTNPRQPVTALSDPQTVEIRAIYSIGGCESKAQTLTDEINAIVRTLTFSNPSPGLVSSSSSTDGVISIIYDGGTPNYTFQLEKQNTDNPSEYDNVPDPNITLTTTPQNDKRASFTGLQVGTYRIKITDSRPCVLTSGDITVSTTPPPTIDSVNDTQLSCTGDNGAITVNVSGGVTPYNYQWTINGVISPTQATGNSDISLNNLTETGEYILKIASNGFTDFGDDSGYETSIINLVTPEQVVINNTIENDISCNGAQDGSIVVDASGATNYEYKLDAFDNWQDLNANTIPILRGGVYDLYLRNKDNGCEADPILDALLVEEPDEFIVVEAIGGHRDVSTNGGNDGTIEISVSGGTPGIAPATEYTYNWVGTGPTNTSFSSIDQNITGLIAGFYEVTVTDANGCSPSSPLSIEIKEPGPLAINNVTIQNQISCAAVNDGEIMADVTGTPQITFRWERNGTPFRTLTDNNVLADLGPGDYQLFISDSSRPDELSSTIISLTAPTVITADVLAAGTCSGIDAGTITISNVAGGTPGTFQDYTYSIDDGATFQNSPLFDDLTPGNYTVSVRDGNDCDFIKTDVIVQQFPAISYDIANSQVLNISAEGRSDGTISPVFLGGVPPFTYRWTGPGVNGQTTKDVTGLSEATYTITATDDNGCELVQDFEITEPGELLARLVQSVLLECNGDDFAEITANIQGGVTPYTFEWFQAVNGNNNAILEDTNVIGSLSRGTYFLRLTDANGISVDSDQLEVTEPDILEISLDATTDVLCSGDTTGAISISVSGGTLPYTYSWSNGQTTEVISNLEAGDYNVVVSDANGCFAELTVNVNTPPDALTITEATLTDVSAYAAQDGSINLQLSGGVQPLDVVWTRISDNTAIGNQNTVSNLQAGMYEVLVTDANGCFVLEVYEIEQPDIVAETIVPPTCVGDTDGSISLLVNQGNGTFSYNWNTGANTNAISNLPAGSYTVTITGFEDGPLMRTYVLEDPAPLAVDLGADRTLCVDQELPLDVTVEDETATYSWTSDNGFSSNEPLVNLTRTGNYTATVSTATGCIAEGSIFVDVSTDEINAEFAASSQVFINETFIAVDISYPLPDSLEWILPDEATILKKSNDEVELRFDTAGEYDIEIITTRGNCIAQKTKKIIVVAPDGAVKKEDTENGKKLIEDFLVYPNPSNGKFTAEVNLTERGNISVKVFSFANNAMMASKKDRGEISYSIPFDLSGLPAGVYAVLLETPYGSTLRKVILK